MDTVWNLYKEGSALYTRIRTRETQLGLKAKSIECGFLPQYVWDRYDESLELVESFIDLDSFSNAKEALAAWALVYRPLYPEVAVALKYSPMFKGVRHL
ncbi:hypothetical protein KIPB_001143 [Kipferlia bialata]|uniref:Uncharacterized protein n=1 Tax=Kipferlia bialata TaxID=797122 RepID=A0A9K3CRN7_9EUKA|nr:hypothetical protein KIPB_001143 [Kipferlia bialata]|eukprot:g1143.t1